MHETESLLEDLNERQRAAVTADDGPLLIVAGAGTGKTTVITKRISWQILSGKCKPDEILAVTFTEKAATEMEERVDRLLPYGYVNLWIMTFHSLCQRILQCHGLDIGLPNDFKLFDATSAWLLVRKNLDRFDLDYYRPLGNPAKFIHALLSHFSRAKDEDISPLAYMEYAESRALDTDHVTGDSDIEQEIRRQQEIAKAYHVYEQLLLENNALDFGSLITHTLRLFATRPAILEKYRTQFHMILVDEFQDTNRAQYELIKMLAAPRNNITVMGDDDQCIYRFRGASYHNIVQFKKDYPQSREVVLVKNYRSSQNILDCAYEFIIKNNPNRLECQLSQYGNQKEELSKKLFASHDTDGIIAHIHCATHDEEVERVIEKIVEIKQSDPLVQWSDFAILVRAHAAASAFIARLSELEIPYQFLSLRGLYSKPAILDCLSYLRLLVNYHDSPALYRVLSWPFLQIKNESLIDLGHFARKKGISLWDACHRSEATNLLQENDRTSIQKITSCVETHLDFARTKPIGELLLHMLRDTRYLSYLKDGETQEKRESLEYLNQFYKKMHEYGVEYPATHLSDFLLMLAYEQEAGDDGRMRASLDIGPDSVKIMTIHAAKGLEFPYVFIVVMVDRRFPTVERDDAIELPRALTKELVPEGDIHLEEERRLLYVALTRAKKGVFLTSAQDYGGARKKKPSLFLYETGFLRKEDSIEVKSSKKSALPQENKVSLSTLAIQPLPLPSIFSFTQLMAFRTCPLQYKFSFILKIPVFGKPQLSFGKTMHLALQKFFELIFEKGNRTQGGLFESDKKVYNTIVPQLPSLQDFFDIYEKSWNDDWYFSARQKEEYRIKGKAMLTRFYEELEKEGLNPKSVERDFTMKFGTPPHIYSLKGRIDRIDTKEDGSVAIIDYKTGAPKQEEKLGAQDKEQLLLYQIASEEVFMEKPSELTYYYLENGKKISFLGSPQEKDALKKKIVDTIQKIKSSDFSATPGWHCKSCDYKDICEFRQL
ncbi:ATP-dependent helicase [Candidatus Uhrbacteria bacterium]|nr:ATP-dependent helicase [Candidatus Uhrbacteria bacterium]